MIQLLTPNPVETNKAPSTGESAVRKQRCTSENPATQISCRHGRSKWKVRVCLEFGWLKRFCPKKMWCRIQQDLATCFAGHFVDKGVFIPSRFRVYSFSPAFFFRSWTHRTVRWAHLTTWVLKPAAWASIPKPATFGPWDVYRDLSIHHRCGPGGTDVITDNCHFCGWGFMSSMFGKT